VLYYVYGMAPFSRIRGSLTAVVAENDKIQVKIYLFPHEGGRWHVHFVRKSDGVDAKIGLWDFELKRPTEFSRAAVRTFQLWVYENRSYLRRKWVQKVLSPSRKELK
jgi:hypothetical protein